ncbi:MAG: hypothetical protein M3R38_17080 [Actinomycetota bacterium]|nr:hypothetical protein [Actinomycetota bacterium]
MTHAERNLSGAFEIEAGTMERFLELLKDREEERAPSEAGTLLRRAVFVAPLKHARVSGGIPAVTRRVRAAFAYGPDLVTLTRLTADGYEFPIPADDVEKNTARQEEVLEETKRRVEDGLEALGPSVPIRVGWLKRAGAHGDTGQER